ncbi:MAG: epoxyqueuosine reductase QueH [Clostridia bacterium]|nr:epoxyqueuosine reductase QueH [Clostridia bacterium]
MKTNNILLHTCCAPCLVYVHEKLDEMNVSFDTYFYNPNIHPIKEHAKRLSTLRDYTSMYNLSLIENDEFLQEKWENGFKCEDCYKIRLDKAAHYAKINGYKAFSTTLLVSIYQNHDLIINICNELEIKYDIEFMYHDFREGYRKGQNKARELGLYRQKYCGCINSYNSSNFKEKINWD